MIFSASLICPTVACSSVMTKGCAENHRSKRLYPRESGLVSDMEQKLEAAPRKVARPVPAASKTAPPLWPGVIRYYWDLLPVKKQESVVTLLEGNTPLVRCGNLER